MPRPIILPPQQQFQPKQSPYTAGFQNMLMRMFMMKFGANIRATEAEIAAKRLEGRQERSDTRRALFAGDIERQIPAGDMPTKIHGVPEPGTFKVGGQTYKHLQDKSQKGFAPTLKVMKDVQGKWVWGVYNPQTDKMKSTGMPAPPPKAGTGGGAPTLPQKQQVILREQNEIRTRNKLNPLDVFELGSLTAEERKKFLRKQTQSVISQLTGKDKTRYLQLTKKLESVTATAVGGLPKARTEVRRGIDPESGRPVIEYSDGTIEYAD